MKRSFAALALAAALAACGQQASAPGEEGAAQTAVSAPAARDVSIGPDGAAGIRSALPMSVDALRAAAPHYAVAEVEEQIEGDLHQAMTLSADGEEMFRVHPSADRTHVHSIVTRSSKARGPTADIIGEVRFAVAPPEQVAFCVAETVDGGAGFACSTAPEGRFWRVYRLPEEYTGPAETFGEIDPDVLHDALLAEMRWIAPAI